MGSVMESGKCDGEWGVGSVTGSTVYFLFVHVMVTATFYACCDLPCLSKVLLICETSFNYSVCGWQWY